jgi:hypothetical protein
VKRIPVVIGLVLLLAGMSAVGRQAPLVHGAVARKQTCKTVTKKVHGKKQKVKVCHTVKAAAKPAATKTPTPTVTPVNTPTPTATPLPGHALSIHSEGTDIALLSDDTSNNSAAVGSLVYGPLAANGTKASSNQFFQWVVGVEQANGTTPYVSSVNNFRLTGADNAVYPQVQVGNPSGTTGTTLANMTLNGPDGVNDGWIAWSIPARANTLTVSWNEAGLIPWTPFAQITVQSTLRERVTYLDGPSLHGTAPVRADLPQVQALMHPATS